MSDENYQTNKNITSQMLKQPGEYASDWCPFYLCKAHSHLQTKHVFEDQNQCINRDVTFMNAIGYVITPGHQTPDTRSSLHKRPNPNQQNKYRNKIVSQNMFVVSST